MTSPLPSLAPRSPLSYGRLRPSRSTGLPDPNQNRSLLRNHRVLVALSAVFMAAAVSAMAVTIAKSRSHPGRAGPARVIALACGRTEYPALCVESLAGYPAARPDDLVPIAMDVTRRRFGEALMKSTVIGNSEIVSYDKSAYADCIELLDDSFDMLNRSLAAVSAGAAASAAAPAAAEEGDVVRGTTADVLTWLSAALTNQDTCRDGLASASQGIKFQMYTHLQNLSELASNTLTLYATNNAGVGGGQAGPPPSYNRRLLSSFFRDDEAAAKGEFPWWVSRGDRMLLESTPGSIKADVVVSKNRDGSGTVATIGEAIAMAPQNGQRRFVIYIRAGQYEESNLRVGNMVTNLWLIGDGMGKTVITGSKSVDRNNVTTFDTATLGVSGDRFVARDITFTNEAGPDFHQAVALRVGSDQSLIYRCEIKAYQDTLYTYSKRQFFRECNVYGTVDFILGNSAVIFQNSTIYSRKPMPGQQCAITAQGRTDARQSTGMSFHACQFRLTDDSTCQTFLGRPWRDHARVVYMMSYLGDHIDPEGWLEWAPGLPLNRLYYGEFRNYGPGAGLRGRVRWPGVHRRLSRREASKFTVRKFISGDTWLTQMGVGFQAGLAS